MKNHAGAILAVVMLVVAGVVTMQVIDSNELPGLMNDGSGLQRHVLCTDPENCPASSSESSIDLCPDISINEPVSGATLEEAKKKCFDFKVTEGGKLNKDRCGPGCKIGSYPPSADSDSLISSHPPTVRCVYFIPCVPADSPDLAQ